MNYALNTLLEEREKILNEYLKEKILDEKKFWSDQRLTDLENAIELIQVGNVESIPLTKEDIKEFVFPSESTKAAFDKLTKN